MRGGCGRAFRELRTQLDDNVVRSNRYCERDTAYILGLTRKQVGCPLVIFKETICSISVAANDHQGISDFSSARKLKGGEIFRLVEGEFQTLLVFGGSAEDGRNGAEAESLYVVHGYDPILRERRPPSPLKCEHQAEISHGCARKYVSVALGTIPFQASTELFPM